MPLKLTVEKLDQILIGDDCIITIDEVGDTTLLDVATPPGTNVIVNDDGTSIDALPLKLSVNRRDQLFIGYDRVITINDTGSRPKIEISAPLDVKIINIKHDKTKQWKNLQREAVGLPKSGSPRFD